MRVKAIKSDYVIGKWTHDYGKGIEVGYMPENMEDEHFELIRRLTVPEVLSCLRKPLEQGEL